MNETIEKVKAVRRFAAPLKSRRFETGNSSGIPEKLVSEIIYFDDGLVHTETKFSSSGQEEEKHEYIYDDKRHLIMHHHSMILEEIQESYKSERDENGRVKREVKLYGDDEGESTVYEYDEKGHVIRMVHHDEEGVPYHTEETEYNSNGKIISRKVTDHSGKNLIYTITYNDKDLPVEQLESDDKGNLISRTEIEYDEKGNEVSAIQYTPENKITHRILTTYDETNRPVKRINRSFNTRITQWMYDEKGRVIEESTTDEAGNMISRSNYEYDDSGRLIQEASFEMDLTHSGRDVTMAYRYEYDFFDS